MAEFGLEHFEASMHAQHALTQRFTAEFSIRPFLQQHEAATLARLKQWASDPSDHVRRLVSEGSRPRLPWASRLPAFQKNPAPVIELLELLKDDPALYVRRSVANNLNDIGKDHPELLAKTARQWLQGASDERRWIVQHALRSAVKRGEAGALEVLGFGQSAEVAVSHARITPARVPMGEKVNIAFDVSNTSGNGAGECPACRTPLDQVTVNPFERATAGIAQLKELGDLQEKEAKLKEQLADQVSRLLIAMHAAVNAAKNVAQDEVAAASF